MPGIYIHIPFCRTKCTYCDFFSVCDLSQKKAVLEALVREAENAHEFFSDEKPRTLYIGGGTPSLCSVQELATLKNHTERIFSSDRWDEVTVEINPDDADPAYLANLRAAGFDRLSIGIQSFIDRDLRFMQRRHDSASAANAVIAARKAGFGNISIDLIYGIPGMSLVEWEGNIRKALSLAPEHISAYHLTIEPGTRLGRMASAGKLFPVDDIVSERQYILLHDLLTAAGYEHYEISNFALPGKHSRHNSSYWTGEAYLGLGPGAHSYDSAVRRWAVADIGKYIAGAGTPEIYESESLGAADLYNEYVMTALRTDRGADTAVIADRFGPETARSFTSAAQPLTDSGLLTLSGTIYTIPSLRWMLSDRIISELFL